MAPSVAGVDFRTPAAVAAAVVFGVSAGDAFVAALCLLVAVGPLAGGVAALAAVTTVARWGTADLGVVAGDQAVLGPAVAVGPVAGAAASACAAAALVLAARARRPGIDGWLPVAALGLGGAVVATGMAPAGAPELAVRLAASVAGIAVAAAVAVLVRRRPSMDRPLTGLAAVAAFAGVALAVVAS